MTNSKAKFEKAAMRGYKHEWEETRRKRCKRNAIEKNRGRSEPCIGETTEERGVEKKGPCDNKKNSFLSKAFRRKK